MKLFIFGIGYTALTLINAYKDRFTHIAGTVQSPEKANELYSNGISAHVFGQVSDALNADIAQADAILASIPPNESGDPGFTLLHHNPHKLNAQWIGYLSTVGVYGDHNGEWVDETSPTLTNNIRSKHRLIAEADWRVFADELGARGFIFRLPGIYGPGRNSLRDIADGTIRHIKKPDQVFNRIHVDDIAASIIATMSDNIPGGIYNITDDEPASQSEVVTYAAGLMGVDTPPAVAFEEAELSELARSFYLENRRVSNAKIRAIPDFELLYPTYREGLAALLQAGEGTFTDLLQSVPRHD